MMRENSARSLRSGSGVICETMMSSFPWSIDGIRALKSIATSSHSTFIRLHISRARSGSMPVSLPFGSRTLNGGYVPSLPSFRISAAAGATDRPAATTTVPTSCFSMAASSAGGLGGTARVARDHGEGDVLRADLGVGAVGDDGVERRAHALDQRRVGPARDPARALLVGG